MYTFFHHKNNGGKCLVPKTKPQYQYFKMSQIHIEHPVVVKSVSLCATPKKKDQNIHFSTSKCSITLQNEDKLSFYKKMIKIVVSDVKYYLKRDCNHLYSSEMFNKWNKNVCKLNTNMFRPKCFHSKGFSQESSPTQSCIMSAIGK